MAGNKYDDCQKAFSGCGFYVLFPIVLLDRSSIAKQNRSHGFHVDCDRSPSRMPRVRRISLGITIRQTELGIAYPTEAIAEITGRKEFPRYLTLQFEISVFRLMDFFILPQSVYNRFLNVDLKGYNRNHKADQQNHSRRSEHLRERIAKNSIIRRLLKRPI